MAKNKKNKNSNLQTARQEITDFKPSLTGEQWVSQSVTDHKVLSLNTHAQGYTYHCFGGPLTYHGSNVSRGGLATTIIQSRLLMTKNVAAPRTYPEASWGGRGQMSPKINYLDRNYVCYKISRFSYGVLIFSNFHMYAVHLFPNDLQHQNWCQLFVICMYGHHTFLN